MAEPFRHNAIMTAGNHLKMSFTSLGKSDGNFKNWVLFFFFNVRIGTHSRGTGPLLGEGPRHAAGGGTSNQELGTWLDNKS